MPKKVIVFKPASKTPKTCECCEGLFLLNRYGLCDGCWNYDPRSGRWIPVGE